MINKNILLLLSFICIFFQFSNAQKYTELASFGWQYSPTNTYKTINTNCDISDINLSLKSPIVLKNKNVVITGVSFNRLAFKGDSLYGNSNFSAFVLQAGYLHNFNDNNSLTLIALPKISGDYKNITHHNFQMGGIILFTNKKSDKLKLKYGCYYNNEFFGSLIVPIFGFDWKANSKLRLFGNLPITATAEFEISSRLSLGLFFNSNSTSYLFDKEKKYINKNTQEISIFSDFYFTKNIALQAKVGYTIGRNYNLFAENDKMDAKISFIKINDDRTQLNNLELKDGIIAEVKFVYRVFQ